MLGQPASSQTVCRPSRRTSDLSSVYSGPVLSRVLIHSGLRSMGTWLLRTSRRSSLRPAGPIRDGSELLVVTVSLMIPTVLPDADRPRCLGGGGGGRGEGARARQAGPAGGPAVGPSWAFPPLVNGSGAVRVGSVAPASSSPATFWASRMPM